MSHRYESIIIIVGLLVFSILGYIAFQQYVERSNALSKSSRKLVEAPYDAFESLEIVPPAEFDVFRAAHKDGLPVDYLVPLKGWPPLKPGYKPYFYKQGCMPNAKPEPTCISQLYVALNPTRKKAHLINGLADLPGVLVPIDSGEAAVRLAMFLGMPENARYFSINYVNLTEVPNDEAVMADAIGYHLTTKAWERLQIPELAITETDKGFTLERAVFIPHGEKQIIQVTENITREGKYTYDIAATLHKGELVPIKVRDL